MTNQEGDQITGVDHDGQQWVRSYRTLPPCGCGHAWSNFYSVLPHPGKPNYAAHNRGKRHQEWLHRNEPKAMLSRWLGWVPFRLTLTRRRRVLR